MIARSRLAVIFSPVNSGVSGATSRAAMVCQHSTDERQREMARKFDDLARGALAKGSGTQRARERKKAERRSKPRLRQHA